MRMTRSWGAAFLCLRRGDVLIELLLSILSPCSKQEKRKGCGLI
nr:hypothetical protein Hi04_10k_c4039_00023 [uncultured bacterium]